jgi:UDP-N-acetylglucosamine 4-epimerase
VYDQPFHSEDISKYRFLVTGGAGFIGSNIVEYLLRYNAGKVVALDNLATGFRDNIEAFSSRKNFQFIEGDICNVDTCHEACKGIDFVLHQAALGSVPRSIQNPLATHTVNSTGFLNVLVAARDAGVKRIVYASSSSVYGDSPELPKVEERIGKPLSPYAVSKLTNELYAAIFGTTYNMEIIGLRYFNIFGPKQNPAGEYAAAIPLFIDGLMQNKAVFINGDGEQTRDFTFVENAVQANIRAAFSKHPSAPGGIFNIAVGEKISVNSLFFTLKKLSGSSLDPSYRASRQGDVRDSLADISKAAEVLDYKPSVKVEQGLAQTLQWFRQRS